MFLISKDKNKNQQALNKMIAALDCIDCGPIQCLEMGDYSLCWSRCKQYENFHLFTDAYYIGKLAFAEHPSEVPIRHEYKINKDDIPPLTTGTIIYHNDSQLIIEPLHITNIFCSQDSVSDMQLLIADAEGLLPSHEGVAVLSVVGYFPGNITLFNEIKKIPFLAKYDLTNNKIIDHGAIPYHKPDDHLMLERLMQIVPEHPKQYIGLSAGYDSRFVLGILKSVNVEPTAIHLIGDETSLVENIADSLKISISKIPSNAKGLSPRIYTIVTDAQIYFRGGSYSKIKHYIDKSSLYHTGLFADAIIKNGFKTAFKVPGSIDNIYEKCINYALLSHAENQIPGLSKFNHKKDLFNYLKDALEFGNRYWPLERKKEWTNWFYYLHRGIRWSSAVMADLSYFTNLIFILSDLEALAYGISSSKYQNFANERVAILNSQLLADLETGYLSGVELSRNPIIKYFQKMNYEYLKRFYVRQKALKNLKQKSTKTYDINQLEIDEPGKFTTYFTKDLKDMVNSNYSYSLKRSAITVAHTLNYLKS